MEIDLRQWKPDLLPIYQGFAQDRNNSEKVQGFKNRQIQKRDHYQVDFDAVCAEGATCIYLGLDPIKTIGDPNPDGGIDWVWRGIVGDTKTSRRPEFMNIEIVHFERFEKKTLPNDVYVFAPGQWPTFNVVGFIEPHEAFQPENRVEQGIDGKPYYRVPFYRLHHIDEIHAWTPERLKAGATG